MLNLAYPDLSTTTSGARTFLEKISQVVIQGSVEKPALENKLAEDLAVIVSQHPDRTPVMELEAVKQLTKRLPQEGDINWRARFTETARAMGNILSVDDWVLIFVL